MRENGHLRLESQRLYLLPLSLNQLLLFQDSLSSLEKDLELENTNNAVTGEMLYVLEESTLPYVIQNPQHILYGTIWIIIHKVNNKIIGDVGFKGAPSSKGLIEVGYGIYPEYRKNGYMSEALNLIVKWAFDQKDVLIIIAETDKSNVGSQMTLKRTQFECFAETEMAYWWRLDK